MDVDGARVWFTDLWNYSVIPYMLEAVREGLQVPRCTPTENTQRLSVNYHTLFECARSQSVDTFYRFIEA